MHAHGMAAIVTGGVAMLAALGGARQAKAQHTATGAPVTGSIDQYLMANRGVEIALARSAVPPSMAEHAEVLVLGRRDFQTAVNGTNGADSLEQLTQFVIPVARGAAAAPVLATMTGNVQLRRVESGDLPIFYEHQCDVDAARMAAFASRDRGAFEAHWAKHILGNPAAVTRTIVLDGRVAGHIGSWPDAGGRRVGYWIGRAYWGRGVATRALAQFLRVMTERPLYAHVAEHNAASIRVLEKCGFAFEREAREADDDGAVVERIFVLP
jgi:RimJ/RimL family protein N-acetyltransferase